MLIIILIAIFAEHYDFEIGPSIVVEAESSC